MFMLSARQYTFVWETTILSPRQYIPLTQAIAAGPKALGFPTPSRTQIEASRAPVDDPEARRAWSGLLVGSVVLYGFGLRLLLLGFALGRRRMALWKYRLDLNRPEFLELQSRLMPTASRLGIVDRDEANSLRVAHSQTAAMTDVHPDNPSREIGDPAIVAFELNRGPHSAPWPPPVHAVHWNDLGFADHRDDQRRVIAQLNAAATVPASVVVVCSLTTTPDRGVAAFLAQVQQASQGRAALVLSGGDALRHRGDASAVQRRADDWRSLAARAGIRKTIDLDLEHFTQASAVKLASLIDSRSQERSTASTRRIDRAFDLIADHVEAGVGGEEVDLHRRVMALYRDESGDWPAFKLMRISMDDLKPASLGETLKTGANRFVNLLPEGLRLNPRWIAAGAAAGALSCIAAASMIAPAAIAALPMWSVLGASVAGVVQPLLLRSQSADRASPKLDDLGQRVRAAAVLSIVLELQGRDEPVIARVLDDTLTGAEDSDLRTADLVRPWLQQIRHRFDVALAGETRVRPTPEGA